MAENINFLLDVGQGRSQAIISYSQVLNYLEKDNQDDETLYKFRAITDHQGPPDNYHHNYKASLYNVMVEWETGEMQKNPCLSLQMIQSHVQPMQRNITC